jgi:hypothetical protein
MSKSIELLEKEIANASAGGEVKRQARDTLSSLLIRLPEAAKWDIENFLKVPWQECVRNPEYELPGWPSTRNQKHYYQNAQDVRRNYLYLLRNISVQKEMSEERFSDELRKLHDILIRGQDGYHPYFPRTSDKPKSYKRNQRFIGYKYLAIKTGRLPRLHEALIKFVRLDQDVQTGQDLLDVIDEFYCATLFGGAGSQIFSVSNNAFFMDLVNGMLRLYGLNGVPQRSADLAPAKLRGGNDESVFILRRLITTYNPSVDFGRKLSDIRKMPHDVVAPGQAAMRGSFWRPSGRLFVGPVARYIQGTAQPQIQVQSEDLRAYFKWMKGLGYEEAFSEIDAHNEIVIALTTLAQGLLEPDVQVRTFCIEWFVLLVYIKKAVDVETVTEYLPLKLLCLDLAADDSWTAWLNAWTLKTLLGTGLVSSEDIAGYLPPAREIMKNKDAYKELLSCGLVGGGANFAGASKNIGLKDPKFSPEEIENLKIEIKDGLYLSAKGPTGLNKTCRLIYYTPNSEIDLTLRSKGVADAYHLEMDGEYIILLLVNEGEREEESDFRMWHERGELGCEEELARRLDENTFKKSALVNDSIQKSAHIVSWSAQIVQQKHIDRNTRAFKPDSAIFRFVIKQLEAMDVEELKALKEEYESPIARVAHDVLRKTFGFDEKQMLVIHDFEEKVHEAVENELAKKGYEILPHPDIVEAPVKGPGLAAKDGSLVVREALKYDTFVIDARSGERRAALIRENSPFKVICEVDSKTEGSFKHHRCQTRALYISNVEVDVSNRLEAKDARSLRYVGARLLQSAAKLSLLDPRTDRGIYLVSEKNNIPAHAFYESFRKFGLMSIEKNDPHKNRTLVIWFVMPEDIKEFIDGIESMLAKKIRDPGAAAPDIARNGGSANDPGKVNITIGKPDLRAGGMTFSDAKARGLVSSPNIAPAEKLSNANELRAYLDKHFSFINALHRNNFIAYWLCANRLPSTAEEVSRGFKSYAGIREPAPISAKKRDYLSISKKSLGKLSNKENYIRIEGSNEIKEQVASGTLSEAEKQELLNKKRWNYKLFPCI